MGEGSCAREEQTRPTHAWIFSQTLAYINRKNGIRQGYRRKRQANGQSTARTYRLPGVAMPRRIG